MAAVKGVHEDVLSAAIWATGERMFGPI